MSNRTLLCAYVAGYICIMLRDARQQDTNSVDAGWPTRTGGGPSDEIVWLGFQTARPCRMALAGDRRLLDAVLALPERMAPGVLGCASAAAAFQSYAARCLRPARRLACVVPRLPDRLARRLLPIAR